MEAATYVCIAWRRCDTQPGGVSENGGGEWAGGRGVNFSCSSEKENNSLQAPSSAAGESEKSVDQSAAGVVHSDRSKSTPIHQEVDQSAVSLSMRYMDETKKKQTNHRPKGRSISCCCCPSVRRSVKPVCRSVDRLIGNFDNPAHEQ